MSDICNRTPGSSLCQWYNGRSLTAQDPKIDAKPDASRLREREEGSSSPSSSASVNPFGTDADHPRPPPIPLPQSANDDTKIYCNKYKTSFAYYCDSHSTDKQVSDFCSSYGRTCRNWPATPPNDVKPAAAPQQPQSEQKPARPAPESDDKPDGTPLPKAAPRAVAESCKQYKSVAEAYCVGNEEGFTKHSCDQYRQYCSGYKEPPAAPAAPALPAGAAEYCGQYASDYSKLCSGERPTPTRALQFCRGYNAICSALVAVKTTPKPSPNFGDSSNPFGASFPNKGENFGGNTNPLVNPEAGAVPGNSPVVPASGASASKPAPAPGPAPAPAPSSSVGPLPPPSSSGSAPVWPGLNLPPPIPPSSDAGAPPTPFGPSSGSGAVSGGQPPNLGVGSAMSAPMFGSSSGSSFGPGGFGSGSNTQAGPIGVSSGSGVGFSPMGIGSGSNTQAGPIGVSSGSGVGLGGGANIPGLGSLGNGANPLSSILGRRRRRRRWSNQSML